MSRKDYSYFYALGFRPISWLKQYFDTVVTTLTNKTLTGPVIRDGVINNTTIGADTANTAIFTIAQVTDAAVVNNGKSLYWYEPGTTTWMRAYSPLVNVWKLGNAGGDFLTVNYLGLTVTGTVTASSGLNLDNTNQYILHPTLGPTFNGKMALQAGYGSAQAGGSIIMYGAASTATVDGVSRAGDVVVGLSQRLIGGIGSTASFRVRQAGFDAADTLPDIATFSSSGVVINGGVSVTGEISAQVASGQGYVSLVPGSPTVTGYIPFFAANGNRQGYIGYSATTGASDTGTIKYVAGIHAFTGKVDATGDVFTAGALVTTGYSLAGIGANRWLIQQEPGIIRSYQCGPDAISHQTWTHYTTTSTGSSLPLFTLASTGFSIWTPLSVITGVDGVIANYRGAGIKQINLGSNANNCYINVDNVIDGLELKIDTITRASLTTAGLSTAAIFTGYGTEAAPAVVVGDTQYGMYWLAGNLRLKSANSIVADDQFIALGGVVVTGDISSTGDIVNNHASQAQFRSSNNGASVYFGNNTGGAYIQMFGSANVTKSNQLEIVSGTSKITINNLGDVHTPGQLYGASVLSDAAMPTVDWNAAINNGSYMGIGAANAPTTGVWFIGTVTVHNPTYVTQEVWNFTSGAGAVRYRRQSVAGVWSDWISTGTWLSTGFEIDGVFKVTNTTNGPVATIGTSQTNLALRIQSSQTNGIIDFGMNSATPWIQATDKTDLSQKYTLALNPNGGNVTVGGNLYANNSFNVYNGSGYGTTNLDGTSGGYIALMALGVEKGNIYGNSGGLSMSAAAGLAIVGYVGNNEITRVTSSGLTVNGAISGLTGSKIGLGTAIISAGRDYLTIGGTNLGSMAFKNASDTVVAYALSDVANFDLIANTGGALRLGANGVDGIAVVSSTGLAINGAVSATGSITSTTGGALVNWGIAGSVDGVNGWQMRTVTGANGLTIANYANNQTYATIDASGNLGLGVVPSGWGGGFKVIELQGGSLNSAGTSDLRIWQNAYYNGGNTVYKTTAGSSAYEQSGGNHYFYSAPSGTAGTAVSYTLKMFLGLSGLHIPGGGNQVTNEAVGDSALISNTTGTGNSAFGYASGYWNTTGSQNTSMGYQSLFSNTTGLNTTSIGYQSLHFNTTGSYNTALGFQALLFNSTGYGNTGLGQRTLNQNTTGFYNVAIGNDALYNNTIGNFNIAVGVDALFSNTTGTNIVAIGKSALLANTTGTNNVAVGSYSLAANTIGTDNVSVGVNSLALNTTGVQNSAIGFQALYSNTTGVQMVAVGRNALFSNTTGNYNTAVGVDALFSNTTGVDNVAVGINALYFNATGSQNTANGVNALYNNTTGINNTANGSNALFSNTTGINNTALGLQSLFSNTTGANNTANGYQALYYNTTGSENTALGLQALCYNTTGSGNICIGSVNAANVYVPVYNITTENDRIAIGTTSTTNAYIQVAWTVVSDARDKTNFNPVPHGLDFVMKLKPTAYQFVVSRADSTPTGPVRYGFKAQDILKEEGPDSVIVDSTDPDKLRYNESSMIAVLVKAIQELKTEFEDYKASHP